MARVEPLRIVLEFARASDAGDPHAFRFAPQSYLVRGERGDFTSTEVAWSRELLADLEALRLPGRDPAALQRVGEVLRRTLEPAGWRQYEGRIVDAVAEGRRVSVTVRSAAAELYALPWELLTLRSTGQSLGAIGGVLLRYAWPATATSRARTRPAGAGGRVLLAWSAAGGAVPAAEHVAALRSAQEGAGRELDEGRDVLEHASYGRLADLLAEAARDGAAIDGLHILCHGGATGTSFGLIFDGEDEGAGPVVVDPGRLQQLLAPYAGMIRLVVLAACDSGNAGGPGNRLGSVAQMLHRVGVAAVVASRYPLSIAGSSRLSEVLYRELLADGATLEEAFVHARTALARDPTTLDWASVQLYARADDGDQTYPLGDPSAPAQGDGAEVVATTTPESTTGGAPSRLPLLVGGFAALAIAVGVAFALGFGPEKGASEGEAPKVAASAGPAATADGGSTTGGAETGATTAASTTGGSSEGATTGATSEGSTSTTSTTATTATTATKKTETKKRPVSPMSPYKPETPPELIKPRHCSSGLVEYLESKLGAPAGGGVFAVKVTVKSSGAVSLSLCRGCDELEGEAKSRLSKASRDRVLSKGRGELPCVASFDWD